MRGLKLPFSFLLSLGLHVLIFSIPNSNSNQEKSYRVQFKYSESATQSQGIPREKTGIKEKETTNAQAGVVQTARPLSPISPIYPELSRVYKEEGDVIIKVQLDNEGQVIEAEVIQSSGHPRLDQSAMDAVKTAPYSPMSKQGQAVSANLDLEFSFRLNN